MSENAENNTDSNESQRRNLNALGQIRFDALMEAACAILVREGHAQLRMRKVAGEAGISVGHLQHFLPTKESLLAALWEYCSSLYDQAYEAILVKLPERPADRFAAIIRFLVEGTGKSFNKRLYIEMWSMSLHYPGADAVMARMYKHHRAVVAEMIQAMVPTLSSEACALRAMQIAALLDGLFVHMDVGLEDECAEHTAGAVADTIMAIATAAPVTQAA